LKTDPSWEKEEFCEFELQFLKITTKYELFILIKNYTRLRFELYVIHLESDNYEMKYVMHYAFPKRPESAENAQPGHDMVLDVFVRS